MKTLAVVIVLLPFAAASAATIAVNSNADNTTAGNGKCTLREAIANVNAAADTTAGDCAAGTGAGDTITFSIGLPAKIALPLGQLLIQRDVSILNPAGKSLQVDGQQRTRVFEIAGGTTHMLNLTIQNGLSDNGTMYLDDGGNGGGVLVDAGATLSMDGCLITFNVAMGLNGAGYGGGIYNSGTLSLVRSVLDANRATASPFSGSYGGAIYNDGTLTLTDCTLKRNRADVSNGNCVGGALSNSGDVTLSGCTFKGNVARADGGAYAGGGAIVNWGSITASKCTFGQNAARAWEPSGGAISSQGNLSLTDCTLSGNRAIAVSPTGSNGGRGGGIDSSGTLVLNNCVLSRNTLVVQDGYEGRGGAVNNGGSATVNGSTFSRNAVMARGGAGQASMGGGIASLDTLTVSSSTFSRNALVGPKGSGNYGGGIYGFGSITTSNSTFVGNRARSCGPSGGCQGVGGGLFVGEAASIVNCTFSGNTADQPSGDDAGGGAIGGFGEVTVTNSILAGSGTAGNCSPDFISVISGGHNISSDATCLTSGGTDLLSTNPHLAALKNNGGPTPTMALNTGSPAINAGDNAVCAAAPVNGLDQRGFVRPGAGSPNCSIGAYEYNAVAS